MVLPLPLHRSLPLPIGRVRTTSTPSKTRGTFLLWSIIIVIGASLVYIDFHSKQCLQDELRTKHATIKAPTITTHGGNSPAMSSGSLDVTHRWDLKYLSMNADFGTNSNNELVVDYEIGINRAIQAELFAKDCSTPITGLAPPRLTTKRSPKNDHQEFIKLKYDFDKGGISGSNIWNAERNKLLMCQVVRLVLPSEYGSNGPDFVITEDKRTLDVDFKLSLGQRVIYRFLRWRRS